MSAAAMIEGLPKRILVTGGAGFIGSRMVHRLNAADHDVSVLAKQGTNLERLTDVLSRITVIEDDLQDREALKAKLEGVEGIFHYAASNIQAGVISSSQDVIDTNIKGTCNLIDVLPSDCQFLVMVGTFLEVGAKGRALKEDDLPEPPNLYSITKLAGTLYGEAKGKEGRPIVTLRMMTPYGPGIQPGRLVRAVLESAMKGEPLTLTAPNVSRDFLYVDDFIDLCLEAAAKAGQKRGEIFNAGTGTATTLEQLADQVLKLTESKSELQWGSFKNVAYDSDIWCADMTKTFANFNWRPKTSLDEGLAATRDWLKEKPAS